MASDILNNILNALQQRPEDILKAAGAPHPLAEGVQNLAELFIPQTSKDVLTTKTQDIPMLLAAAIPGGPVAGRIAKKGVRPAVTAGRKVVGKLKGAGEIDLAKTADTLQSLGLPIFRKDRLPFETQLISKNAKELNLLNEAMKGHFKGSADDVGTALFKIWRRLSDDAGILVKQRTAAAGIGPVDISDLTAAGMDEFGRFPLKVPNAIRKNLGKEATAKVEKVFAKKASDYAFFQNKARAKKAAEGRL